MTPLHAAAQALLTQLDHIGMTREEEPLMEALRAALAVEATAEPVAIVESWTNGSYSRNYKLRWIRDVPQWAPLYASPPQQWLPISEAPKDGTEVLLSNGLVVHQGAWVDHPAGIKEHRDIDGRYTDQTEDEGYTGWVDYGGGMLPEPTHFQPKPPLPKEPK